MNHLGLEYPLLFDSLGINNVIYYSDLGIKYGTAIKQVLFKYKIRRKNID